LLTLCKCDIIDAYLHIENFKGGTIGILDISHKER